MKIQAVYKDTEVGKWELIMCKRRKKNKNKIIIDFLGEERNDVTGRGVIVKYPKGNDKYGSILLDCGLVQGESTFDKDISKNRKMLDRLSKEVVSNIEYVLLSHAHVTSRSLWKFSIFKF